MEAQAPGGQVVDLHFQGFAAAAQVTQLGRDTHPGVLALGFGLMHDIDVHGGIHGDLFLFNPIGFRLTRP
ncbi:hypothetical protein D3C84_750820 [compost metagenome]